MFPSIGWGGSAHNNWWRANLRDVQCLLYLLCQMYLSSFSLEIHVQTLQELSVSHEVWYSLVENEMVIIKSKHLSVDTTLRLS